MLRNLVIKMWGLNKPSDELARLLQYPRNQEEFLGVSATELPDPDKIINDSSKLVAYSQTTDYKVFAKEAWARVLSSLDVMLDDRTSVDRLHYHRGAIRATLDLLRLSYQARSVRDQLEQEKAVASVPPRR